ncbi:polysaccharide export protein, partial [Rhizobium ruizarguesonis]
AVDQDLSRISAVVAQAARLGDCLSKVQIYRLVPKKTVAAMHVDATRFTGETVQVIIRANLRDPETLFAVQQFKMEDKDIIYISN